MPNYTVSPTSQIHARTGIITSAGTLLSANDNRTGIIIQNLNTAPLYIKFGTSASASDFDFILKGGTDVDDGNGGIFSYDVLSYTGVITVYGTTVRCTATDF